MPSDVNRSTHMIQGRAYVSLLVDFERFSLIPVICELKVHHFRHFGDPSANFVAYNADLAAKDDASQMPKVGNGTVC